MHPAGLQEVVGATDVRFERRKGISQCGRDDWLRSQVEHRIYFMLIQSPLEGVVVFEPAVDHVCAENIAAPYELGLGIPITDERNDTRTALEESLHQP